MAPVPSCADTGPWCYDSKGIKIVQKILGLSQSGQIDTASRAAIIRCLNSVGKKDPRHLNQLTSADFTHAEDFQDTPPPPTCTK
jgi:hypothetical protein